MVESAACPSPYSVTTRRAALRRMLQGVVAAVLVESSIDGHRPSGDSTLQALARELSEVEATRASALARLERTERRLFVLRPVPPEEILIPADAPGFSRIVPVDWSVLRRHLRRRYAGCSDARERLAAARRAWEAYHSACASIGTPDWLLEAEAAAAEMTARVQSVQMRIAQMPASTIAGLRLKLALLWSRSGRAPGGSDREDWGLGEALLWSALQDATGMSRRI